MSKEWSKKCHKFMNRWQNLSSVVWEFMKENNLFPVQYRCRLHWCKVVRSEFLQLIFSVHDLRISSKLLCKAFVKFLTQLANEGCQHFSSVTVPLGDWLEKKKVTAIIIKTTIWVSHVYYLNPEFHKILWRAFWVIAILRFSPYVARVDFKGLISK